MNLYLLLPLLGFIVNLALIPLVLRGNRKSQQHQVFSLFLLVLALWGLTIFQMRSSPTLEEAARWEVGVFATIAAIGVYYFHFSLLFTRFKTPQGLLPAVYVSGLVLIALLPTGLVFKGMQTKWYGYAPVLGPLAVPYILYLYVLTTWCLVNTIKVYRNPISPGERNRAGWLALGLFLLMLGATSDYLPVMGVPVYPMGIVTNVMFAAVTAYAIARHQLLDVHVAVRKGLLYSVVSGVLLGAYALVILFVNQLLGTPRDLQPILVYLGGLFLVAIAFQPLYHALQKFVDQWFYRGRYDALRELRGFAVAARDIADLEGLAATLVRLVVGGLQTERACLLLASPQERGYIPAASAGALGSAPIVFTAQSPPVQWMRSHDQVVTMREVDALPNRYMMPTSEVLALQEFGAELFVPLKTRESLVGVLVLGPKKSHQPFSQEDVDLLQTVCSQAATRMENARLYSELRRQLDELRQAQAQLVRSEKLAAVGELAANVAHEVNNPLQTIINLTFLVEHSLDENDPRKADLRAIQAESLRARHIVKGLLDFARQQKSALADANVNEVAEAVLSLARVRTASGNVKVVTEMDRNLPPIRCDAEQIKQVFLNMVNNAMDAMPSGGTLTVRSRSDKDGMVAVEVTDTGDGIPPEVMPRIFEPFFTTKPVGQGTGLGLAVSYQIVKKHGGVIKVESTVGKGSAFTVCLPLTPPKEESAVMSLA
ncbi:MAG: ATP-binding protein [Dehalococcoidia bacterium]|nr:ATP-binding protein [Dehalococcoidia bacterium]